MSETADQVPERWLKPREVSALFVAAGLFPIPPSTLRDWGNAGRLQMTKTPGGHRRVRESDARALLDQLMEAALPRRKRAAAESHLRDDPAHQPRRHTNGSDTQLNTVLDLVPPGPYRRTKSADLWVEGMVAMYLKAKGQFAAENMGADFVQLLGEPNLPYAKAVLARYRAERMTAEQAGAVADAHLGALALSQIPAQRQYAAAGVTA